MHIGDRLREERERLGLNQAEFAASAGYARKSQFNYETGKSPPDATYLVAIEAIGVDVVFVLFGRRGLEPAQVLNAEEMALVRCYRSMSTEARAAMNATAIALLAGIASPDRSGVTQNFHGKVGTAAGRDIVNYGAGVKPRRKKLP